MYVHCTYLIFQKIPAVIKTCLCTKISYLVKSDLLLQIKWIFRVILHPFFPPHQRKRKKERIICHDNVMSYVAGYLSHNFCSIVRARLAILLPNDFWQLIIAKSPLIWTCLNFRASTVTSQSPETYIRCTLQYWLQKDGICNKISITPAEGVIRNHSKKAPQMSCVDWPLEGHALEINVVYQWFLQG